MEQDNSKVAWGKALKPIFALLLVIVLWQVLVLEMLKNGIISTLIAVVLVSAVSVVIFGIVFWVVKSLLNQFLTIAQGKTEDEQEQTKIGEKAKKLMEREDDIGLMMRSVHDSISSFATVISGIKTATEELKSVSDDFNNIFHDMEDSLKITQDSTHTIADNTVTQAAQTADMKEKIDAIGDLIAMISENVDALNASADKMQECNESAENIMGELIDISKKNGEAIENVREQSKLTNDSAQQIQTVTDIIADISNATRMEEIFKEYKPQYIFHAAAYKHVPMMEDNVSESIQINVYGTRTIADLAVKYGAEKFVMISTDKAVNPTNVMGCSKRICEIYVQSLAKKLQQKGGHVTQFITTRFGNVLGSNGSVIPRFRDQIQRGGPVTVTHPEIIRYFMTIPEACRLVLEAGSMGNGGEIYIFDMGKPVKIVDLAKRMISLSGRTDVKIEFTGLRHGEKLYEELLNVKELTKPTYHEKIMIATVREYDYDEVKERIQKLIDVSYTYDQMKIVSAMKDIVPEFISKNSCFEALDKKPD